MPETITIDHPFDGGGTSTVKRVYIIVHEPARIPDKKVPPQTHDGVTEFLMGLELCMPKGTTYTVVELIWTGDIWVTSGFQWLEIDRITTPRKHAKRRRKVAEEMQRIKTAA